VAASSSTFLKNGFRGFRNASVKFPKTLGKHISLNIGESVSYPNFARGPLLDDMRLLFGPCKVLGTHH